MLARTLEPEVMDDAQEAALYDAMDHRDVNRSFVDDWIQFHSPQGDVLDLGSGSALIPIEACRRDLPIRIVAVDLSPAMLQMGRIHLELAGLTDRIRLDRADAKQLPYPDRHFQSVVSNSLIHHLDQPERAFKEAIRVTALDGHLFVRDLVRPDSLEQLEQLATQYAGHDSPMARQLLVQSLHAALRLEEVRSIVQQLGFPPETVQRSSDRHWTWRAAVSS